MLRTNTLLVLGLVVSCAGASSPSSGESDVTAANVVNQSGADFDASKLHDPIADTFLRGSTPMPATFKELAQALFAAQNKEVGCSTQIALVSERAQLLGKPDAFRSVMIRLCGTTQVFLAPLQTFAAGAPTPVDVEIMAFDDTSQVYDFYALEAGRLHFMGTSIGMLDGPGKGSGGAQERRCANCHTGGGPVMKELELPWANWDGPTGLHFNGGTTSPGSDQVFIELVSGLGLSTAEVTHATGDKLQNVVQAGNQAWNKTRLAKLSTKDTASLLKPLFCTVEANLQTSPTLHEPLGAVGGEVLINTVEFSIFDAPAVVLSGSPYTKAIAAHQTVLGADGKRLTGSNGKALVDTAFAFNHPFASFSDNDYIDNLKKVTSDAFVNAVLGVDFTTPVFSDRRCNLLKHAPPIAADLTHPGDFAKALADGFAKSLSAGPHDAGSPEAELLQNLADANGPQPRVTAFLKACSVRATKDSANFTLDLLKVQSLQRSRFRALPIFEHRELLPEDDFKTAPGTHLDSVDCTLKP